MTMDITPDLLLEREKLKKRLINLKWLVLFLFVIIIFSFSSKSAKKISGMEQIARIRIEGVIENSSEIVNLIKEIETNKKIKALILHIDSPGSTSFAGEELYLALKKLRRTKPIVSVLGTLAASGGYMTALGTNYVIARNMTLTGSIGVLWQSFEVVELANKLGIKFISLKSSPLKATPNPMEAITSEMKEAALETIQDSFEIFLNMVIENRNLSKEQALKLSDGRLYTGKRAKELKLIDAIGGEDEALEWLEKEKKISKKLSVEDYEIKNKDSAIFGELSSFVENLNIMMKSYLNNGKQSLMFR